MQLLYRFVSLCLLLSQSSRTNRRPDCRSEEKMDTLANLLLSSSLTPPDTCSFYCFIYRPSVGYILPNMAVGEQMLIPIPSHPIPSHPIPSHPIQKLSCSQAETRLLQHLPKRDISRPDRTRRMDIIDLTELEISQLIFLCFFIRRDSGKSVLSTQYVWFNFENQSWLFPSRIQYSRALEYAHLS
jgi:hypothetical protein